VDAVEPAAGTQGENEREWGRLAAKYLDGRRDHH
jgi:hypothetical protein